LGTIQLPILKYGLWGNLLYKILKPHSKFIFIHKRFI
jgi:hypothetical protein